MTVQSAIVRWMRARAAGWVGSRDGMVYLAAVLAVWAVAGLLISITDDGIVGIDFYEYWAVIQAARHGDTENIYSQSYSRRIGAEYLAKAQEVASSQLDACQAASAQGPVRLRDYPGVRQLMVANYRKELEVFSTPWMYTVLSAFSRGNYERDLLVYHVACVGAMLAAVVVFCRAFGLTAGATLLAIAALTSLGLFGPQLSDVRVGNVARLQLAMLALYVALSGLGRWRGQDIAAGALLGMAVLFKPNIILAPALLLGGWMMNRRFAKAIRQGAGLAAGAVTAVVASSLFFRSASVWVQWVHAIRKRVAVPSPVSQGNCSLTALVYEATGVDVQAYLLAALVLVSLACIWVGRRKARPPASDAPAEGRWAFRQDALIVAVGAAIGVPAFRLGWLHYFVLIIPLVINAFGPVPQAGSAWAARVIRGIAGALALLTSVESAGPALGLTAVTVPAVQMNVATFLVLSVALWDLAGKGLPSENPLPGLTRQ